jgi:hypothetical protein
MTIEVVYTTESTATAYSKAARGDVDADVSAKV